jgi:hypothetical protein
MIVKGFANVYEEFIFSFDYSVFIYTDKAEAVEASKRSSPERNALLLAIAQPITIELKGTRYDRTV